MVCVIASIVIVLLKLASVLIVFIKTMIWESEWLLFNANSAIFQLYHGENNLIINESTLY
jgi:hypothetical protein